MASVIWTAPALADLDGICRYIASNSPLPLLQFLVRELAGARLSEDCNRILAVASVLGREFRLDVLARVSGSDEDALLESLDEAEAARVVAALPGGMGRYRFAHALIREMLYDELTTARRARLHRRAGEALEAAYGANAEPHLAELAHHFGEAAAGGEVEKALDYAQRAGDRARSLLAYEDAARHYELALQALELVEPPDPARRYYEQALEVAGRVGFRAEIALTHLAMADLTAGEGPHPLPPRPILGEGEHRVRSAPLPWQ